MNDDPGTSEEKLLSAGQVISARFKIVRLMAEGGMAFVYEATMLSTGRRVALKALKKRYAEQPEVAGRFRREAQATVAIDHPSIVSVLDLVEDPDGGLYIAYEFLVGEDLAALRDRQPIMSEERVLEIIDPVLNALTQAHTKGVVHRDLKPDNIFLARNGAGGGEVKVLDFGIARIVSNSSSGAGLSTNDHTQMGVLIGTPTYMSPEQLAGGAVDRPTDLWAIGVMTYTMLTGEHPFPGANPDAEIYPAMLQVEILQGKNRMPRLSKISSEVMQQFIQGCLSIKPTDRPTAASALEIVRTRRKAITGHSTNLGIAPPRLVTPVPQAPGPELKSREPTALTWSGKRSFTSRPIIGLLVMLFGAGLSIALGFNLLTHKTRRPTPHFVRDAQPVVPTPIAFDAAVLQDVETDAASDTVASADGDDATTSPDVMTETDTRTSEPEDAQPVTVVQATGAEAPRHGHAHGVRHPVPVHAPIVVHTTPHPLGCVDQSYHLSRGQCCRSLGIGLAEDCDGEIRH